ncbi:MAG: hypothetical protein Q7S59_08100 [Sulfurimonas sp.]|nr:hypothetical protein [Sulfurimonas sp.]
MAYIYKDGKVSNISISEVKLPKLVIKKVDSNVKSKNIMKVAIETVKNAKVTYAF